MRPAHSSLVLLALLLANAVALLFFRFFTSVDGPIHVLHASLLDAPWPTAAHEAQGIVYNTAGIPGRLGDRILMVLLLFLSPLRAHDVFAALVCCAVVLSAVAYLRANGTRLGLTVLWLAPLTFNLLLIMGLFHFLLGVAVAFASVAWWRWHANSPRLRWSGLLLGVVLAWFTHRGSPPLLGILFLLTYFTGPGTVKLAATFRRSSLGWRIAFFGALGLAVVVGMFRLGPLVRIVSAGMADELPTFDAIALLRPLFLLDRVREAWLVISIGLLLLFSLAIALWARWRMGRARLWHDGLLVLFLGLILISWVYGTRAAHKVFIAERCQWLAMLTLTLWLAAIADARRGWVARVIGGAALCALPLHIVRLVWTEEAMAPLREVHAAALEASAALAAGSLVVPVVTDSHILLQHLEAYIAIDHDGILVAPAEHVSLLLPPDLASKAYWLYSEDTGWLVRHWRKGIPEEADQLLFMGRDVERAVSKHPWPTLLPDRFRLSYDNGSARIYTALHPEQPEGAVE